MGVERIAAGRLETQRLSLKTVETEVNWIIETQPLASVAMMEAARAAELTRQAAACLEAAKHRTLGL